MAKKKKTKKITKAKAAPKPRNRVSGERRRLNLKLDEELTAWAFDYAERHATTITQLITDHLVMLKKIEDQVLSGDAEQI
jgi:hypothetical protein